MSTLPASLHDFANVCQSHFGSDSAGCNEDGVYVAIGHRMVQVNLDSSAGRAVFWTELARPAHAEGPALEEAALLFSSRELLDHGMILAINDAAELILLGRSIEQDVLQHYAGLKLLNAVAEAAARAEAALVEASQGFNGSSSAASTMGRL